MRAPDSVRTGAAIRKLRLARGMTLADLSEQTGIPLSTLSRVELGQNALKMDKLVRLCRALDVDVGGLMTREAESVTSSVGRRSVARAGEGRPVQVGPHAGRLTADDLTDRRLSPLVLDVVVTTLETHGPMLALPGEVYLTVLAGAVALHSPFYTPLDLAAGDAIYFDGRAGWALLARGRKSAQVLIVAPGEWRPQN
jgi:transcriptional regulator with XRE-family HTH domain